MGWGLFTFLPLYVGYMPLVSSKELLFLGQSQEVCPLGVTTMPLLLKTDAGQVLMPFTGKPFNPGAGGLLAALMMGIVVAYLERAIDKVIPSTLKTFLTPLLTLIVGAFYQY